MTDKTLANQARIFTHYLVKRTATSEVTKLYELAISRHNKLGMADEKLLELILRYPTSIGLIDAGLVFHNPHSELRRRLYIMFAILEASPAYYDNFLAKQRSPQYIIFIGYSAVRAVVKAFLGILLLRVVGS